jgi:hypothetical protein
VSPEASEALRRLEVSGVDVVVSHRYRALRGGPDRCPSEKNDQKSFMNDLLLSSPRPSYSATNIIADGIEATFCTDEEAVADDLGVAIAQSRAS